MYSYLSKIIKSSVVDNDAFLPAQRDSRHRHPRDTTDAPPLLPAVTVTGAGIFILLLLLWSLAPVTTVTATVVYEEGEDYQEGDDKSDGR